MVRACGGLTVAEDRVAANAQWMADKTGVTAMRNRWREDLAPRISSASRNAWQRVEQASATALERLASRTTTVLGTIDSGAGTVKDATTGRPNGTRPGGVGSSPAPARGGDTPDSSGAGAP